MNRDHGRFFLWNAIWWVGRSVGAVHVPFRLDSSTTQMWFNLGHYEMTNNKLNILQVIIYNFILGDKACFTNYSLLRNNVKKRYRVKGVGPSF